jgi:hypothetical protein
MVRLWSPRDAGNQLLRSILIFNTHVSYHLALL